MTLPLELTDEGEKPIPLWQKIAGVAFALLWLVIVVLWHGRAGADFYPLDASRIAPNLLASFIIFSVGLIAGALLWPPFRRRMHRAMNRKLAPIHDHLAAAKEQRERHHAEVLASHAEILRHQKHIIRHTPGIPDEVPPAD